MAGGVTAAGAAEAGIVHTEVNLTANANQVVTVNIGNGSTFVQGTTSFQPMYPGFGMALATHQSGSKSSTKDTVNRFRALGQHADFAGQGSSSSANFFANPMAAGAALGGTSKSGTSNTFGMTAILRSSGGVYGQGNFGVGTGYLGLRIHDVNTQDPAYYGWAQVSIGANSITLIDWAFEDSGGAIAIGDTGAVPAPGALGLLGLAAGAAGLRRRRSA